MKPLGSLSLFALASAVTLIGALVGCYGDLPPPGGGRPDGGSDAYDGSISIELRARPPEIEPSQTSTLTFSVSGADRFEISGPGGEVILSSTTAKSGRVSTGPLTETSTFELVASHDQERATKRVTVMVLAMVNAHARIETTTVSHSVIPPGDSSLLQWTTSGAKIGRIRRFDGTVLYEIPSAELSAGRYTLRPTTTSIYELSFTGLDELEITQMVLVRVAAPGTGLSAAERFRGEVSGTLEARCAPCHANPAVRGPDFLGTIGTEGYRSALIASPRLFARPEDSLLYLKGEHAGPEFSSSVRFSVAAWLLHEREELRVAPTAPSPGRYTPRTLRESLLRAGACLTRADFEATYLQDRAGHTTELAHQTTTPGASGQAGGPCYDCHELGTGGVTLKRDGAAIFPGMRRLPMLLKLFSPDYDSNGVLRGLVASDRFEVKGADMLHPAFTLTPERKAALRALTDRVLTRHRDPETRCDQEN